MTLYEGDLHGARKEKEEKLKGSPLRGGGGQSGTSESTNFVQRKEIKRGGKGLNGWQDLCRKNGGGGERGGGGGGGGGGGWLCGDGKCGGGLH